VWHIAVIRVPSSSSAGCGKNCVHVWTWAGRAGQLEGMSLGQARVGVHVGVPEEHMSFRALLRSESADFACSRAMCISDAQP